MVGGVAPPSQFAVKRASVPAMAMPVQEKQLPRGRGVPPPSPAPADVVPADKLRRGEPSTMCHVGPVLARLHSSSVLGLCQEGGGQPLRLVPREVGTQVGTGGVRREAPLPPPEAAIDCG